MKQLISVIAFFIVGIIATETGLNVYSMSFQHFLSELDSETKGEIVQSRREYIGYVPELIFEIRYIYTVGKKSYRNNLVNYDLPYEDVNETLDRYPVGKTVTVYYDSEFPKWAVLEKSEFASKVYMHWGINFIAVPLVGFLLGRYIF